MDFWIIKLLLLKFNSLLILLFCIIFLLSLLFLFFFNILLSFFDLFSFILPFLFLILFKEFVLSIINLFLLLSVSSKLFFNFFKFSWLFKVNFININIFLLRILCSLIQKIRIPIKLINIAPKMQSAHKFLQRYLD